MPIYEYECKECDLVSEAIRSFISADLPLKCENCHSMKTKRIVSTFFSKSSSLAIISGQSSCNSCSGGNCSSCH